MTLAMDRAPELAEEAGASPREDGEPEMAAGQTGTGDAAEAQLAAEVEAALGVTVRSIEAIAGGLGLRSFYRVETAGTPARLIVRVEAPEDPGGRPPGIPPEPPLEPTLTFLAEHGIPVPLRFGGGAGVDYLEDLGDRSLEEVAGGTGSQELRSLYEEACDLVARFQKAGFDRDPAIPAHDRHLDAPYFEYKAALFADWSLPAALGRAATPAERTVVTDAFAHVAEFARTAPQRLAHRDFQSANLFVRSGRRAGHRLAVIDFQGAFLAPPEYDLVCLLRDSYVELPEEEVTHQLERIRPRLPDHPRSQEFALRFDALTLTRKGKDHARFLYAAETRRDRRFLRHVPTTVRALKAAARRLGSADARFAPIAELVEALPLASPGAAPA